MASRSSYTKSKRKVRGEDTELVPVRSGIFYGLQTKLLDQQKTNIERNITVIPNITFYDNNTKVLIDFSDYLNNIDKNNVKPFFDLLISGTNFTITNAEWLNPNIDKLTYDLSGTYRFTKIVDSIIFADVISTESISSTTVRYDKEYFQQIPTVSFTTINVPQNVEIKSYILNIMGKNSKNSFSYLGARKGDWIQIQDNQIKYKIDSVSIDAEGKEAIVVFGELDNNDFIGTPILISLNQPNIDKIQINYNNEQLGKCELLQSNTVIECIDNHTLLQSKLREDNFNNITTKFYPGEFCTPLLKNQELQDTKKIIDLLKRSYETNQSTTTQINQTMTNLNSNLLSRTNLLNNLFG